jgi:hypothetical protein
LKYLTHSSDGVCLFHSSNDSVPEDLLAKLHDFPHVPDKIVLQTMMLPPSISQDGLHISGKDSSSVASLAINTTAEVLGKLPSEEEGDATKEFLDPSRILRAYVHHKCALALTDVHLL